MSDRNQESSKGKLHGKLARENDVSPIHVRLADTARQEEKRRRLLEFLRRPTPAWSPDDHPDIEAAGGAAAWVRKLRAEAESGFRRRTGIDKKE